MQSLLTHSDLLLELAQLFLQILLDYLFAPGHLVLLRAGALPLSIQNLRLHQPRVVQPLLLV